MQCVRCRRLKKSCSIDVVTLNAENYLVNLNFDILFCIFRIDNNFRNPQQI